MTTFLIIWILLFLLGVALFVIGTFLDDFDAKTIAYIFTLILLLICLIWAGISVFNDAPRMLEFLQK